MLTACGWGVPLMVGDRIGIGVDGFLSLVCWGPGQTKHFWVACPQLIQLLWLWCYNFGKHRCWLP